MCVDCFVCWVSQLGKSEGEIENVLVITDHFSGYVQAYLIKNQTDKTTAWVLFDKCSMQYAVLLSSQEPDYTVIRVKGLVPTLNSSYERLLVLRPVV